MQRPGPHGGYMTRGGEFSPSGGGMDQLSVIATIYTAPPCGKVILS